MPTTRHPDTTPPTADESLAGIAYPAIEGIGDAPPELPPIEAPPGPDDDGGDRSWRDWMMVGVGVSALIAVLAVIVSIVAVTTRSGSDNAAPATAGMASHAAAPAAPAAAPTLAQAKGMKFEKFEPVDATLPAVPAGAVKKFRVDVLQHVTQVDPKLAPIEAWSYAVNGVAYRGTAASPPIVVNQGDKVQITLVNGGSKKFHVTMPHSIDFHAAEVAPNKYYTDIAPGKSLTFRFDAKHAGVFMYHCATQPVLMHTSAGMVGMLVVKPRNLAPVDKELWVTQEEYYLGKPGQPADMAKMAAETPDVIAFNGYANQYKTRPITVKKGERIRMYVLNAGPSKWSAFHVIGTVFDTTRFEGVTGHDSQTVSLAPSQGGWAEFTLDQEGNFPFVTHAFGDMVKGAAGILHTTGAPKVAAPAEAAAAPKGGIGISLGEMFVKSTAASVKAGKVTFQVKNIGATMHQFAIGKAPLAMAGAEPAKSAAQVKGKMLNGGQSEAITAKLAPGSYILYCLMPGHYSAGQKLPFTVSR